MLQRNDQKIFFKGTKFKVALNTLMFLTAILFVSLVFSGFVTLRSSKEALRSDVSEIPTDGVSKVFHFCSAFLIILTSSWLSFLIYIKKASNDFIKNEKLLLESEKKDKNLLQN